MTTTSNIPGSTINSGPYIVVLESEADLIRALLFDSEARRVEGYSAQLPHRTDAAADCLDEMHRLIAADGFRVGAVVGRPESDNSAEDRKAWPAFAEAKWFASLPDGAGVVMGSGGVSARQFVMVVGSASMIAAVVDTPKEILPEGFACTPIDDRKFLLAGEVPEAGATYTALRKELKGSIEAYLETAKADDPRLATLDAFAKHFHHVMETLSGLVGRPSEVMACGSPLLKSPTLTQRIANALGVPLTLCTEPEPSARGAALWALERIGAIQNMEALAASTATIFKPVSENQQMNHELLERASRIRMLLMDVDGVLTDAKLYNVPGPDGKMWETKGFDAQDGIALQWLSWYGIETGVISGRVSPATEERARQVKMTHVYQGHIEKIPILEQISKTSGIPTDAIAYIGDDLTDVVVMRRVLLAVAPANARPEVKKVAHMVTTGAGGHGAVREVCELLLQAQGKWPEILKKYEIE